MKAIKNKIVVIREKSVELEKQIIERTMGYIVASFSLVAGLAWNDAIKVAIEEFFPMGKDTIKAKFTYAIAITAVVVFVSVYLVKLFKKEEEKIEEKTEEKAMKAAIKKTKKK